MLVTLEINNKDKSYEWFLAWMASQTALKNQKSRFAPWARSHQLSVETVVEQRKNGSSSALFKFVAGPGTHYFKYKNAWLQVSHILTCDRIFINVPYIRSNVKGKPDLCN
jgi:chaperone BCS1